MTAESLNPVGVTLAREAAAAEASEPAKAIRRLLADEAFRALRLILIVSWAVLALVSVVIVVLVPWERAQLYLAGAAAFAALSLIPWFACRSPKTAIFWTAVTLIFDLWVVIALMLGPNPALDDAWPVQLNFRLLGFLFILPFLGVSMLSHSPKVVAATGTAAIAAWSLGFAIVAALPETKLTSASQLIDGQLGFQERLDLFLDPFAISLTRFQYEILILAILTALLVIASWRSRRILEAQLQAELGRAQLTRYFSPNIAERLTDGSLSSIESQRVVVMFVDLVGFSSIAEGLEPRAVVALLRDFNDRVVDTVFRHDGTVDKFIGDCVMATFGTPSARPDDAARAIACVRELAESLAAWRREREARGERPIEAGIGLHCGEVVVGDMGSTRRVEYTVIGDTVNVAARLEHLTRELGVRTLLSEEVVAAARAAGAEVDTLRGLGEVPVRGRRGSIVVATLDRSAPPAGPRPETDGTAAQYST